MTQSPSAQSESAVIAWLTEKWGDGRKCPYCDGAKWDVARRVAVRVEGAVLPLVPVVCANCAHTVFLSTQVMGLDA